MTPDVPRTLFVGRGNGPVVWYRCALPAMVLGQDWIGVAGEPGGLRVATGGVAGLPDMDAYDVLVLQQPSGSQWLKAIRGWQAKGITVLYEVDDWLRAIRKLRDHDFKDHYGKDEVEAYELCMRACDGVICSTAWLADRYRAVNPNTVVCRNGIDLKRYALTRPQRDHVGIGWAGATGHREGMRPWVEGVATVMRDFEATRFWSVGQTFAQWLVPEFGRRATSIPFSGFDTYPAAMTHFDVALAPAGKGNFFRGKSDLRWLEASALGVPLIADAGVYPEIEHGVTGFHAETPAEMAEVLRELVADRALRERVGAAARAHVTEHRSAQAAAVAWAEVLRDVAGERPGRREAAQAAAVRSVAERTAEVVRAVAEAGERREQAAGGPRVSVVVAAYNYADYLGAAIESALGQDVPDGELEVIVVDDGSTDATPEVVASFGDRIRAIRQDNQGLVGATHTGIAAARGEFITFLDADDEWPRDRTRKLVDAMDRHPQAGVVYGDMEIIDADGRRLHRSFRELTGLEPLTGRVYGRLLAANAVSAGAMMVRAALKDTFHPPVADAPLQQDWWIVCRVAEVADVVAIPDVVNRYRHHGSNMNLGADDAQRRRLLAGELPFRRWLLERVEAGHGTRAELLAALANFDGCVAMLGPGDGVEPLEADTTAWMAAMQDASAGLDRGDVDAAFAGLVRAAAAAPSDPQSRSLITELAGAVPAAA